MLAFRRSIPFCSALALAMAGSVSAQETAPKAFGPTVEVGVEERVRTERWNNLDHNDAVADARIQYRFRSRLWAVANLTPALELAAGICNENRKIKRPDNAVYNGREVFFETLYADYKFSPSFSARVGRQNLVKGEGFIFTDGTPGDGSRTGYYDAVDLAFTWSRSRVDLLAISNTSRDRLPQINRIDKAKEANLLAEWNEQALGVYYSGKEWKGATLDAYYLLKVEKDFNTWNSSKVAYQPDRTFSTLGARLAQDFGQGWNFTAEYACQWGSQEDGTDPRDAAKTAVAKDISAWGGYARLKKGFAASWKPSVSLGYIALSGQDPDSDKITTWNPVFSRFPKWSEFYAYALAPEKGIAYWQNMGMWELEFKCSPCKHADLRATYYRMSALEKATVKPGTDKDRGDLYEVRADVRVTPEIKGHVVYERMVPGHFNATDDLGYFFRAEVSYTFKHLFKL